MLQLVIVVCLALAVTAAPLQKAVEKQQILSRVKRADEMVLFGNLQNHARVKKTDVSVPLKSEEADLDKKATMEADLFPASKSTHDDEPLDSPEGANIDQLTDSEEEIESELTAPLPSGKQTEETDDSEEMRGNENTSKEQESASNEEITQEENANKGQVTNSDEINSEDEDVSSGEENVNDAIKNILDEYNDYYNFREYYPETHQRGKRGASEKKRSTSGFTAEDMSMAKPELKRNTRVKRDLTEDAIRAILGEDETSAREYDPDLAYREELSRLVAQDPEVDNLLDNGYPFPEERYEGYQERYPIESEDLNYPLSDDELAEERARLILLKYFYDNPEMLDYLKLDDTEDDYNPPPTELSYPVEVKRSSSWDGLDYENRQDYRPIVYEGQPGIFIPVKRQLITMLPGQRKRSFYPYNQEPEGQWGAFVPDQQKRNREEYERLYRLARALKRNRDWSDF